MPTGKLYLGSTLVSGGILSDQHPSALLNDGVSTATSIRNIVTCTADATPHTAGTWVEVDASLSAGSSGVVVRPNSSTFNSTANTSTLLDIGIGAAGSETVWATIGVGYINLLSVPPTFVVPGAIASGTRVSVRLRSAVTVQQFQAIYTFLGAKGSTFGTPVTYLANTATSRGTTLTAPGSLNAKGAWLELVTSTATALAALHVSAQAAGVSAMASGGLLLDIGVGAAGSEVVVISDLYYNASSSEHMTCANLLTYGIDIPAGSRIAARYARANAANALDLVLVGAPPA